MKGDEFFIRISTRAPFTRLHPRVASFFKDYLAKEKAVRFGDSFVVNTNFPPYPSRAFDRLAEGFGALGDASERHLYSVTLAVTNRCRYHCWHCYNAGRSQEDIPLDVLRDVAAQLQDLGAVIVTLTGGEPLLRDDVEEIARAFDERSCLILGTTGAGLTAERARRLHDCGVFAVGISLDAMNEQDHDRRRGRPGAFRTALDALRIAREAALYPYIVSVATREFLQRDHFTAFMRFAGEAGALEVHLLEPSATGRLAGQSDVLLSGTERRRILEYQAEVAQDESLPILSSLAYLESPEAFGCGAGITHLYIDGSGEVCPCNLVPLSFGNVVREPLAAALDRMARHFRAPRCSCVGRLLASRVPDGPVPTPPDVSDCLCDQWLPRSHPRPRFFRVHSESRETAGGKELQAAYDRVHKDYDTFWLVEAAKPIDELVNRIPWRGDERVFEAGCGTGYATALLAERAGSVLAADLSEGMLAMARERLQARGLRNAELRAGDALELLALEGTFDVVFSSWVLGYIPLRPFFATAARGLASAGLLAFVVHKENSPREPTEIFAELVASDPSVLQKRVAFDFPRDADHLRSEMPAEIEVCEVWEAAIVFRYPTPEAVLEHLLKSGAGTAFHDAVVPERREAMTAEFIRLLAERHRSPGHYEVPHEYLACIARKR
jgi:MoaA/NifB/PqqE/SkfB family radical SAM enzyme/SAM-dependent methyltransferase